MIKPLNGNVILKKKVKNNMTKSGIILSNKKENEDYATVVAVSDFYVEKGEKIPTNLKPGDEVIYKSYSSTDIKYENEEYNIVFIKDILAIIK